MPTIQSTRFCDYCNRQRLFTADSGQPNRILHALLTIFTLSAWGLVWIFLEMSARPGVARCSRCGEIDERTTRRAGFNNLLLPGFIALILLVLFAVASRG